MHKAINFYPGSMRDSRELSIDTVAAYSDYGIVELVDSMIVGTTASADFDGALAAVEDGALWADLCAKHGDDAVQEALEELHALLVTVTP